MRGLIADQEPPGRQANNQGESRPDQQVVAEEQAGPADLPFTQRQSRKDRAKRTERTENRQPISGDAKLAVLGRAMQEEAERIEEHCT